MPVPASTPSLALQNQLDELRQNFSAQAQQIGQSGLSDDEHNNAIMQLRSDFDKQYKKMQSLAGQFNQTQQLAEAGLIPSDKADEAMWRMILPKETATVMFEQGTRPMTVGELTGKPMTKTLNEFAVGAPSEPDYKRAGFFRTPRMRTQENLLKQYKGWRQMVGYEGKTTTVKTQLDRVWDDKMKEDKGNQWDPSHPEIQSLRAKGALTSAYGTRNQNAPITSTLKTSPFTGHVQEKVAAAKPEMVQVKKPDGTVVKVPAGEWAKQKVVALQEGWSE